MIIKEENILQLMKEAYGCGRECKDCSYHTECFIETKHVITTWEKMKERL